MSSDVLLRDTKIEKHRNFGDLKKGGIFFHLFLVSTVFTAMIVKGFTDYWLMGFMAFISMEIDQ